MSKSMLKTFVRTFSIVVFAVAAFVAHKHVPNNANNKIKIYWFIPDGLRADHGDFNIFKWAENGEMPNLRMLMTRGSYGYSRPVFPGHTPTNFATLLTGVFPDKHGIADGTMRTFGYPLKMVSKGGFSSVAKLVAPIWTELETADYLVSLQSVPGSTPPEIFRGNVIKGRWGGWGVEFPSLIVQSNTNGDDPYRRVGNNRRVFTLGPELTTFVALDKKELNSYQYHFEAWGQKFQIVVKNNKIYVSSHDANFKVEAREGEWSQWHPVKLKYQLKNDYQINSPKKTDWENELSSVELDVNAKVKLISVSESGEFRLRILFDSLNDFLTYPMELAEKMQNKLGPMIDFVDNYPPQLVYHQKDKETFLEEAQMSWDWHRNAVPFLMKDLKSDVVIHSVYNPNQMLTSRWWLPFIDQEGHGYNEISDHAREVLWNEVKDMYRQVDNILGEIIKNADENTYIVFSSDHGVIPLNNEVRLNNLFAKKGWLKYKFNIQSKNYEIDWKGTQVVFLQMNNVYINPEGLDGPYQPARGVEYDKLRSEVIREIKNLKDDKNNKKILSAIWKREDVAEIKMPTDRVGDLVISPLNGYSWVEDISDDGRIVGTSVKGGYKQALDPEKVEGLLTPFLIVGPGIKAGNQLKDVIRHVDQYATLAKITNIKHPTKPILDGNIIEEVFIK